MSATTPAKVLRVTKEQLDYGWRSFHPGKIPNVRHHAFEIVLGPLHDGSWIVKDPQVTR